MIIDVITSKSHRKDAIDMLMSLMILLVGLFQGVPRIAMATTELDLGEVKKSAGADYNFTFKNEGDADLVIKKVAPS
jgi:hypothetical protein